MLVEITPYSVFEKINCFVGNLEVGNNFLCEFCAYLIIIYCLVVLFIVF